MGKKSKSSTSTEASAAQPPPQAKVVQSEPAAKPKAAPAKAESKAKAEAKAKSEPKPEQVQQAPAAPAKAASAGAKSAPAKSAPAGKAKAAGKAAPVDNPPKANEKASPPKSQGASAKAKGSGAKASAPAASAPAASAKGKAKSQPAPAPPPPPVEEEEEGEEVVVKKKKKRNKAKEEEAPSQPAAPAAPKVQEKELSPEEEARRAEKDAEKDADKDEKLVDLRAKIQSVEQQIKAGTGTIASLKPDVEKVVGEIDAYLQTKAPRKPKAAAWQCAKNLREIQRLNDKSEEGQMFISEIQKELKDAKDVEVKLAIRNKMNHLKTKCEKLLPKQAAAVAKTSSAPDGGKGASQSAPASGSPEDRDKARMEERYRNSLNGDERAAVYTKTLELAPDVMRSLFTPPNFSRKFQRDYKVVLESVRGPKGGGKGGKGGGKELAKEVTIAALSEDEVAKCVEALKKLDFSGTETREVSASVTRLARFTELESEFGVLIDRGARSGGGDGADRRESLTIYGSKGNVQDTIKKLDAIQAEDTWVGPEYVAIDADKKQFLEPKVKDMKTPTLTLRVGGSGGEKGGGKNGKNNDEDAKVIIKGKTKAEVDAAKAKVEEMIRETFSQFVKGDLAKISAAGGGMERDLVELINRRSSKIGVVMLVKKDGGVQVVGPSKKDCQEVKGKIEACFKRSGYDPVAYPLEHEIQMRAFNGNKGETFKKITKETGANVWRQRDENSLQIHGDPDEVEKATAMIKEVIKAEAFVEVVDFNDNMWSHRRELEQKHHVQIFPRNETEARENGTISIMGPAAAVEDARKAVNRLGTASGEEVDTEMIIKKVAIASADLVGRVIGPRGANLKKIREACNVVLNVSDADLCVEIKGRNAKDVDKAEDMVKETLAEAGSAAPAAAAPAASGKAKSESRPKKAEKYEHKEESFPTLGGPAAGAGKGPSAWGKAKAKAAAAPTGTDDAEQFPTLGGTADDNAEDEDGDE